VRFPGGRRPVLKLAAAGRRVYQNPCWRRSCVDDPSCPTKTSPLPRPPDSALDLWLRPSPAAAPG